MHWHDKSLVSVQPAWLAAEVMQAEAHDGIADVRVVQGSVPAGGGGALVVTGADETGADEAGTEEAGVEEAGGVVRVASQAQRFDAASRTELSSPSLVQAPRTQPKAACWIAEDEAGIHWQERSLVSVQPTWLAADVIQAEAQDGIAVVSVVQGSVPAGAGALVVAGGEETGAEEAGADEAGADEAGGVVRVASQAQRFDAASNTELSSPSLVQAPRTQPKAACWMADEDAGIHWHARSLLSVQPAWLAAEVRQAEAQEGIAVVSVVQGSVPAGCAGALVVDAGGTAGDDEVGVGTEAGAELTGAADDADVEASGVRVASQAQRVDAAPNTEPSSPSLVQAPRTQPKAACWIAADDAGIHWPIWWRLG